MMCVPRGGDSLGAISIVLVEGRSRALASCDTQASGEVVNEREQCCLEIYRRPKGCDAAHDGDTNNESDVEPVDVFVPILLRHGLVCDVSLLRIICFVSVGL